jgi:hypothetical protein
MKERKRIEKKSVVEIKPKVRGKNDITPKKVIVKDTTPQPKKPRVRLSEDKFIRVSLDSKPEERKDIGERIQRGELVWGYYGVDNDKGYIYYLETK